MSEHGFQPNYQLWPLTNFIPTLGNGVALFFMISGFVIPPSLDRHQSVLRFFADRLLRVLPLFVAIHLLVFGLGPLLGYKWMQAIDLHTYLAFFATNLLFIAPLFGHPLAQQNAWTLAYEWVFYAVASAEWSARKSRSLYIVVLTLSIALIVFRPSAMYFVVGFVFARCRTMLRLSGWVEAIILPLSLVSFYYLQQYVGTFAALPFGAVVFALVITPNSIASCILRRAPFQFLGKISYSLYLLHPVVLYPLQRIFGHLAASDNNHNMLFVTFVVFGTIEVLICSMLSYKIIEVNSRDWLAKLLSSSRRDDMIPDSPHKVW
jgi:peptidoglycan/LPS O-acetylase OafA/YrhL